MKKKGRLTGFIKKYFLLSLSVWMLLLTISSYGKDIVVKSPGNNKNIQPAIREAVDKAENGDRVILPEGEFLFERGVVIKKFISFKGQGLKKTILYRSEAIPDSSMRGQEWRTFLTFDIRSDESSGIVVSGICFRSKKPSVVRGDGGSRASGTGVQMNQCVDFLIEECRFENFGHAAVLVIHKDTLARGLIRKNEFYYNAGAGSGYGVAVVGTNETWVTDPKFGSANFIFVEDNIFDYHRHSMAADGAALYVFRYNTVLNNATPSGNHAIDTHEARPGQGWGNVYGTRAVEVYNNKLINTTYTFGGKIKKGVQTGLASLEESGIAIRSGEAVVYNNEISGYRYAVTLSNWFWGGTQQPYPVLYGPGYLSGKAFGPKHKGSRSPRGDGDVFIWDNKVDPFLEDKWNVFPPFYNDEPVWWKEGRDYHLKPKPGYKPYPYPYPVK
ncbi:MAG: right-handed parallel beta-helix repeat-containing protein [Bacteroidetes bacterium]|nr:right-handed parallel beta-helix repeat-containing protein [Bacteroidota bacterium]